MARISKQESTRNHAAERIKAWGSLDFTVEWIKSKTWGRCARIRFNGDTAAHASGCGYDKLSAVVDEFLRPLAPEAEHTGGCGIRSTIEAMAACGWTLTHAYEGKNEDGFRIERA